MKNRKFSRYYLFACLGILLASSYPIAMGVRVIGDMLKDGYVLQENYPKYVIPYTPVCIALLLGVLLMPLFVKLLKKLALLGGSAVALGAFFLTERMLEEKAVVQIAQTAQTAQTAAELEAWQMSLCVTTPYSIPTDMKVALTPVDILIGNYSPAFKLHFYMISVVLILALLNCIYGFAQIIRTGETKRLKALILQSVSAVLFLGLCILACFTAFWRDGNLQVSALSASLMAAFFILLGVTVGVFTGSFLLGKRKMASVWLPAIIASVITLAMYLGEMILLSAHLYIFGTGWFFEGLPGIVLAPVDLLVILASGGITALLFSLLNRKK